MEHNDPPGSFSDFAFLDPLTPKRVPDKTKPSEALKPDYGIPTWDDIKDEPVRKGKPTKWSEVGTYTDYAL